MDEAQKKRLAEEYVGRCYRMAAVFAQKAQRRGYADLEYGDLVNIAIEHMLTILPEYKVEDGPMEKWLDSRLRARLNDELESRQQRYKHEMPENFKPPTPSISDTSRALRRQYEQRRATERLRETKELLQDIAAYLKKHPDLIALVENPLVRLRPGEKLPQPPSSYVGRGNLLDGQLFASLCGLLNRLRAGDYPSQAVISIRTAFPKQLRAFSNELVLPKGRDNTRTPKKVERRRDAIVQAGRILIDEVVPALTAIEQGRPVDVEHLKAEIDSLESLLSRECIEDALPRGRSGDRADIPKGASVEVEEIHGRKIAVVKILHKSRPGEKAAARCRECGTVTWKASAEGPKEMERARHRAGCSKPPSRLEQEAS